MTTFDLELLHAIICGRCATAALSGGQVSGCGFTENRLSRPLGAARDRRSTRLHASVRSSRRGGGYNPRATGGPRSRGRK
jgi:hypothetical protein